MSATWVTVNGDGGSSLPVPKRPKTGRENKEGILPSVETPQNTVEDTPVGDLEGQANRNSVSVAYAPATAPASTQPVSSSIRSPREDAVATQSRPSTKRKAVDTTELSTSQSSLGASIASAPDDHDAVVDLATAPSDPIGLAVWVAEQIKLFASNDTVSVATQDEKRRRSLSHAPGIKMREKNDRHLNHDKLAKLEKARELGRARKAHWRKKADEANRNNDLRCRLHARSKQIFGEAVSDAKTKWINAEFVKRKAKRAQRESHKRESAFTGFEIPLDLGAKLFFGGSDETDSEAKAAGTLLLNALHVITSADSPPSNRDAAFTLKSALKDPEIDTKPFEKALRILCSDTSVMSAIIAPSPKVSSKAQPPIPASPAPSSTNFVAAQSSRASSHPPEFYDGRIAAGGEPGTSPAPQQLQLRGGTTMEPDELPDEEKKVQAINTAIGILKLMANENTAAHNSSFGGPLVPYVTPYERPYKTPYPNVGPSLIQDTQDNDSRSHTTDPPHGKNEPCLASGTSSKRSGNDNEVKSASTAKESQKLTEDEEVQADLLLRFAGSASLSDGGDDDVIELYSASKPEPDTDVQATLEHIYKTLESRDVVAGTAQAAALRSAISDAGGVAKNHYIPRERSLATSRLYAHLASRAHGASMFLRRTLPPLPPLPPGPLFHHSGNFHPQHPGYVIPQHPGGAFTHYPGNGLPHQPGALFIPHPGGVFTSPHYPGGYFVPHPSGFYPPAPVPGNVAVPNQVVLPHRVPSLQARPFVPSSVPPPPVPTRIGTARGKTAEEARKVRDFGFPPLPGSRPGENPLGTKRKLLT